MNKILSNLFSAVLVVCALLITASVVRRELFPPRPERPRPREIRNWEELRNAGQAMGERGGPVTIVEFSDFQCPFCARAAVALREVRARYPDRVTVIYRHYPLTNIHPHAVNAALAAECAAEQGRFESLHDAFFAQQDSIGTKSWRAFAEEAGVADLAAFDACIEEQRYAQRVVEDTRAGDLIGVRGTPSIVVGNLLLPGTPSFEDLETHVLAALGDSLALARLAANE